MFSYKYIWRPLLRLFRRAHLLAPGRFLYERRPDVIERHFDGNSEQHRHADDDQKLFEIYLLTTKYTFYDT